MKTNSKTNVKENSEVVKRLLIGAAQRLLEMGRFDEVTSVTYVLGKVAGWIKQA